MTDWQEFSESDYRSVLSYQPGTSTFSGFTSFRGGQRPQDRQLVVRNVSELRQTQANWHPRSPVQGLSGQR